MSIRGNSCHQLDSVKYLSEAAKLYNNLRFAIIYQVNTAEMRILLLLLAFAALSGTGRLFIYLLFYLFISYFFYLFNLPV